MAAPRLRQRAWRPRYTTIRDSTLIDAQRNFAELGAMELRFTGLVRWATADEPVDEDWRPIDLALDSFEPRGVSEQPWPSDATTLYWWRRTFWRAG